MDAVEFVEVRRRMYGTNSITKGIYSTSYTPEEIVVETEKWAKEHPVKTRQSEFLKMFPRSALDSDGGDCYTTV